MCCYTNSFGRVQPQCESVFVGNCSKMEEGEEEEECKICSLPLGVSSLRGDRSPPAISSSLLQEDELQVLDPFDVALLPFLFSFALLFPFLRALFEVVPDALVRLADGQISHLAEWIPFLLHLVLLVQFDEQLLHLAASFVRVQLQFFSFLLPQ